MTDAIGEIIAEAKSSGFTTIPKLSDQDVSSVWEVVSSYIERQMSQNKGVQVPGLGVFTFSQRKLNIGNNRTIVIQRPVFQLSEKFAQTHKVEHAKQYISGQIPVVSLNYSALSMESPFSRDTVERCVREVLLALSRCVQKNRTVEFTFAGIGRLAVRDCKAKMKFFKEFITSMDGTGGHLINAFSSSRASSLVAGNTPRSPTTVALPKIVKSPSTSPLSLDGTRMESRRLTRSAGDGMPPIPEGSIVAQNESSSDGDDDTNAVETTDVAVATSPQKAEEKEEEEAVTPATSRPNSCSHGMAAGQELCYLCHQREMRNVPVSFVEERHARQLYEDRLLQQYQRQKDFLAQAREQAKETKNRDICRKMAGYNFEAGENRKRSNGERPDDKWFQKSYVFDKRPVTEPPYAKQLKYSQELETQVNARKHLRESLKKETDLLERLEQIQLAEELAASREVYLSQKATASHKYQKALEEQIRCKPLPLPAAQPDSIQPIFGIHDMTDRKMQKRREIAESVFHEQLQVEREKDEDTIKKRRWEQEEELKMLKRNKEELVEDMKLRHQERIQQRNELEQSWAHLAAEKKARDVEEAELEKQAGALLHEQCDKYHRCRQCKRRTENVGKSNVLKETRFIAGAKLIL